MNTKLMRTFFYAGIAVSLASPARSQEQMAPKHEVGLTLDGFFATERQGRQTRLELGSGIALQANYGHKFVEGKTAALYGEFISWPTRSAW
jgi:D-lyxose ketol-isomerase